MSCLNIWRVIMGSAKGRISARNKKYWIDKGYSDSESITLARSRTPGTIEYFNIFKKLSIDESTKLSEEWIKRRAVTLENMINRYGDIIGLEKWNIYRAKQAEVNTFEYKRLKYGWTQDDFDEYNNSRAVTLENMISRHGLELGHLKWNAYCDRQAYAGCKLEYFIEKYGEVEGLEKYSNLTTKKAHSLESYILRCDGDVELATTKYNIYWSTLRIPSSNIANEMFDLLYEKLTISGYKKIFYSNNLGEWYIWDNNNKRIYFTDFYCREVGKVIEFNGDYWHANPKKYPIDTYMQYPNSHKILAQDVWTNDEYKINLIKNHPDIEDVLVIWESDYRENKQLIIEKCLNFLLQ